MSDDKYLRCNGFEVKMGRGVYFFGSHLTLLVREIDLIH